MSNRLRVARHRLEMKQPEFGELLGVSTNSITKYETGQRPLSQAVTEKLVCLESALDADPELGERLKAAWEGKTGFLKSQAAWAELLGPK